MAQMSRRSLMRSAAASGTALLVGGVGWQFRPTTPADFPSDRQAPADANRRLLIVYASMMGSTGQQAQWMAEAATELGYATHLERVETAPGPEGFDAVLFGSAIRSGQWLDPALDWASRHGAAVNALPHGLFQCSMTCAGLLLDRPDGMLTAQDKTLLGDDLKALHTAAPALAQSPVAFFPGRLEFHRLTPVLRIGYPFVSGSILDGDHRRATSVRDWSTALLTTAL